MGRADIAGVIAPPPLIFGIPLAGGLFAHAMGLGWDVEADWPGRAIGGGILCFAGALLIVLALSRLLGAGTRPEPWKPTTAIVTDGVYRLTRNPMYLGMAAIYAGVTIIAGCLLLAGLFVPVILLIDRGVIEREEAYLARRFGQPYLDYLATSRRWL